MVNFGRHHRFSSDRGLIGFTDYRQVATTLWYLVWEGDGLLGLFICRLLLLVLDLGNNGLLFILRFLVSSVDCLALDDREFKLRFPLRRRLLLGIETVAKRTTSWRLAIFTRLYLLLGFHPRFICHVLLMARHWAVYLGLERFQPLKERIVELQVLFLFIGFVIASAEAENAVGEFHVRAR